jgi:hypothetical protein
MISAPSGLLENFFSTVSIRRKQDCLAIRFPRERFVRTVIECQPPVRKQVGNV